VVHVFSPRAREYYDLERLWRSGERIDFPLAPPHPHPHHEPESGAARR